MYLRKPRCTATLYASGCAKVMGLTSEDDAIKGARRIARIVQKLGYDVKFAKFQVVNVTAKASLPFGVDLIKFCKENEQAR